MASREFYLQVLGANSAIPTRDRFPSSFILGHYQQLYLIDCGEGAQIKMAEYGIRKSKIDHIFISHLHGDHVFGLPGLLNSYTLGGRTKPMAIYGPTALKTYIDHIISATGGRLGYDLNYHLLEGDTPISLGTIDQLEVTAIPLRHRIPTYGYVFRERSQDHNIAPGAIAEYQLSIDEILVAKSGQDIVRGDVVISNVEVTLPVVPPRSFAYCSDTVYDLSIVPHIRGANMIYHEATYLHELADKAAERMHSTAREAAMIAMAAGIKQLVIGHYSSRYKKIEPLLVEAQSIWPATSLAVGGQQYHIT